MKYAVVTGASSGIGREFARQLHRMGFRVILAARRKERLLELKQEFESLGAGAEVVACDLATEEGCLALLNYCRKKRVSCVVNAAGVGKAGWFTDYPLERDLTMLDVDVRAVLFLTKQFLRLMPYGRIYNISSMAGFVPGPGMAVYGAAKAFLISFGESVNYELKRRNSRVRVITVCPGPVDTEFDRNSGVAWNGSQPIRRWFKISAPACAKEALRKGNAGKTLIVPGRANRILKAVSGRLPLRWQLAAEYRLQSAKFEKRMPGEVAKNRLLQEQKRFGL